jgi:hypothetical protein
MAGLTDNELKRLFVASMKRSYEFTFEEENPFFVNLSNERFYVHLKNISNACFKNRPDVTRVQLHRNLSFINILKKKIPIIILGYDAVNDVYVNWNPDEIKGRLNARRVVSLYSRQSIQNSVRGKNFKEVVLTSGGKVIVFKRHLLIDFFKDWKNLYDFEETNNSVTKPLIDEQDESPTRVFEITDKEILRKMTPLLKGNRVLEAATLCHKHYASR